MFKLGSNRKLSPLIASKLSRSCPKTYAVFELMNDIASEMANLECSFSNNYPRGLSKGRRDDFDMQRLMT